MTASPIPGALAPAAPARRFAGLKPLLRKDEREWVRGKRAWIVLVIAGLFMVLTAANGWISATIAANLPPGAEVGEFSLDAVTNLLAAVSAQIFVLATIFAVASLIVGERQAGTLAWVASKPVSRNAIWVSKWISSSATLGISAAIVPLVLSVVVVAILYGMPPIGLVVGLAVGMTAVIAFFAAVGLAAGTVMPGQAAITATGFGVFALAPLLAGILPFDVTPVLPTSMLTWAAAIATGGVVSWVTPLAWLVATGGLVAISLRQMSRMEL